MNETLITILLMSFSGAVLAIVLFLLKPVIRNHVSKAFLYYIWLPVLIRLIVPFGFAVNVAYETPPVPALAPVASGSDEPGATIPISENYNPVLPGDNGGPFTVIVTDPETQTPSIMDTAPTAKTEADSSIKNNVKFDFVQFLLNNLIYIWLAGAIVSFGWYLISYAVFYRRLSRSFASPCIADLEVFNSMRRTGNVRLVTSEATKTPLHMGILRPVIVLPRFDYTENGMEKELRDVLRHELTHWRRRDILYKWFAVLVQSVHWFNPVVYFIRWEIDKNCELSCDEAVVRVMNEQERISYGNTLLALASENVIPKRITATTLSEGKRQLKERIISIRDYKKSTRTMAALMLVVAMILTGCATAIAAVGKQNAEGESINEDVQNSGDPFESLPEVEETPPVLDSIQTKKPRYGNTSGNISNDGYAARDGDDFFYVLPTNLRWLISTGDMIKTNADGSASTVLYSGERASCLNVIDGWIYYIRSSPDDPTPAIWKMRTDGSEDTLVTSTGDLGTVLKMTVVDDEIYFLALNRASAIKTICRVDTDGGKVTPLHSIGALSAGFAVYDGWIYYSENGEMYRLRTDGSENKRIADTYAPYISIADGKLYYASSGIWSMNLDGSNHEPIVDDTAAVRINVADGWIYYADTSAIYKIRTDGTEQTHLCEFFNNGSIDLNVLGDWIYLTPMGMNMYRVRTDGSELQEVSLVKLPESEHINDGRKLVTGVVDAVDNIDIQYSPTNEESEMIQKVLFGEDAQDLFILIDSLNCIAVPNPLHYEMFEMNSAITIKVNYIDNTLDVILSGGESKSSLSFYRLLPEMGDFGDHGYIISQDEENSLTDAVMKLIID